MYAVPRLLGEGNLPGGVSLPPFEFKSLGFTQSSEECTSLRVLAMTIRRRAFWRMTTRSRTATKKYVRPILSTRELCSLHVGSLWLQPGPCTRCPWSTSSSRCNWHSSSSGGGPESSSPCLETKMKIAHHTMPGIDYA